MTGVKHLSLFLSLDIFGNAGLFLFLSPFLWNSDKILKDCIYSLFWKHIHRFDKTKSEMIIFIFLTIFAHLHIERCANLTLNLWDHYNISQTKISTNVWLLDVIDNSNLKIWESYILKNLRESESKKYIYLFKLTLYLHLPSNYYLWHLTPSNYHFSQLAPSVSVWWYPNFQEIKCLICISNKKHKQRKEKRN